MKKNINLLKLTKIGFINKPHGFNGELQCVIEQGDSEDYNGIKFLFIQLEGKPVPFFVEQVRMNDAGITVKLEDINSEAEAKTLTGKNVLVETPEIISETEEHNWDSLIGYRVITDTHGSLGPLEGIEEYPQQLIGRCTVKGKEVLFPLNNDLISSIDDDKKEIHLNLPDGLLDIYMK